MGANFESIQSEVHQRGVWNGVDYGRNVRVLARTPERLLIWVPGQSAWSGTGQPWRYAESTMIAHSLRRGDYKRLSSGGRLAIRLKEKAAAIDGIFGDGFSKLLDPARTIVVGGVEPESN